MERSNPLSDPARPFDRAIKKTVLAIDPRLGAIYRCRHCRNVHLRLGAQDFCMDDESFAALADMVLRAAANDVASMGSIRFGETVQ